MGEYKDRWSFGYWGFGAVTLIAIMNSVIAVLQMMHIRDQIAELPKLVAMIALLIAVLAIWLGLVTTRKLLHEISAQVDALHLQRLRGSVFSIALMANVAIVVALSLVR